MQYLRAKKDIKLLGKKYYFICNNELLTMKEFTKLKDKKNFYNLSINDFELVNISKQKIFFMFGVRQEKGKGVL